MPAVMYPFWALWAGWLLFWLIAARGNKRTAVRSGLLWQVIALAVVLVVRLVWRRFPAYFEQLLLPPSAVWVDIGLVLTACGLGFTVWARRVLGTNWSATPSLKENHDLVQRGPYRLVRHPIYTGLLFAAFGTWLAQGRVSGLCVLGMAAILLILKLNVEEALLTRRFPEAYLQYRRRVKAIVPFLY